MKVLQLFYILIQKLNCFNLLHIQKLFSNFSDFKKYSRGEENKNFPDAMLL